MASQGFDDGYVRLHRRVMASDLWQELPLTRIVAFTMVMRAEWRPGGRTVMHPESKQQVHVERGQVLLGLRGIADAAAVSHNSARRAVDRLLATGFIARTTTPALYSVPGYEKFNPLQGKKTDRQPKLPDPKIGPGPRGNSSCLIPDLDQGLIPNLDQGLIPNLDQVYKQKKNPLRTLEEEKDSADSSAPAPGGNMPKFKLTHPPDKPARVPKRDMDAVVLAYCRAVEHRLGFVPKLGSTEYKHVRDLILRHGAEHAATLAAAYPKLDNRSLHGKGYPLALLMSSANEIEVMLRGLGPRKRRDPLDICTDPDDPRWLLDFDGNPIPEDER